MSVFTSESIHTFLYSQILEMFVNIGLEVKKSSSSKSAVAGNFTPQSNNHKLFCSMSRNPKMMFGICRFWQGTPEVFSKRWKPWSAHPRHCCRFASDRRESFG